MGQSAGRADHAPRRRSLTGWGRTAPSTAEVTLVTEVHDAVRAVRRQADRPAAGRGVVARGLGRSYGDAAQNAGGLVLDMTALDRVLAVDDQARTADVEAGASLDAVLRAVASHGLWLPVLPGTRHVTVGGAIAADVHGKNHHAAGSLGAHVSSLDLLTADGEVRTLRPDDAGAPLFWATVAGLGLTGVITRATIRLVAVETAYVVVDTERADDLDALLGLLSHGDDYPYSVAWFDATKRGRGLGRAVLTRGRPARVDDLDRSTRNDPLRLRTRRIGRVPFPLPQTLVNRVTARAFNAAWFHHAPRTRRDEVQTAAAFFHPLDAVADWNLVYGRAGFCQYQMAVPHGAEDAVRACVELIASSAHVSCLNVLKRLGPANPAPMSFAVPGWTLAVDLPVRPDLDRLLRRLDDLVLGAGGRIYLVKDSRLPPEDVAAMYPRAPEFVALRRSHDPDGLFCSDLSRRLGL